MRRPLSKQFRYLSLLVAVVGMAAATLLTAGTQPTLAQEEISAAIVEGTCESPGDVVADLRSLTIAEGGAMTSFTTVDLTLEDLTGSDFAIVVGDPDDATACGEITGSGSDVYVTVPAQVDDSLGGVAWLRARDTRTQVSLFAAEGLGGSSTSGDNGSNDDDDGPPEPPDDETPEPQPPDDETPEPSGDQETYTAPTYGYSITYDAEVWLELENETSPGETGPTDYFVLVNRTGVVQAEFIGVGGVQITPLQYIANWVNRMGSFPEWTRADVRLDDEGNEIRGGNAYRAFVAIDFTRPGSQGREINTTYFITAYQPEARPDELLVLVFQTDQTDYDDWVAEREQLEEGIVLAD